MNIFQPKTFFFSSTKISKDAKAKRKISQSNKLWKFCQIIFAKIANKEILRHLLGYKWRRVREEWPRASDISTFDPSADTRPSCHSESGTQILNSDKIHKNVRDYHETTGMLQYLFPIFKHVINKWICIEKITKLINLEVWYQDNIPRTISLPQTISPGQYSRDNIPLGQYPPENIPLETISP